MPSVTLDQAQAAKAAALRRFQTIGKVVGVGITRVAGDYAVKINLSEPVDPSIELPTDIDGVPVRVEVVGTMRPRYHAWRRSPPHPLADARRDGDRPRERAR